MFTNKKGLIILAVLLVTSLVLTACTKNVTNTTSTNERGYANPQSIVTATELKNMDNVVIVDFTEKGGKYIPGAVRITRKESRKELDGVPGMNINKEEFEALMSKSGIQKDDIVVIYDGDQELWASRLWWTMKVYGHEDVRLLDGGLDAWLSADYEIKGEADKRETTKYEAEEANKDLVATLDEIEKSFNDDSMVVLDTRSDGEWKDGRIPGAIHIEWTNALNKDGTFKGADALKSIYEEKGITSDKVVIPHCKSGVRATHSLFVLSELLGYENVQNYDGSWVEYKDCGLEIEK